MIQPLLVIDHADQRPFPGYLRQRAQHRQRDQETLRRRVLRPNTVPSKRYLTDFGRRKESTSSEHELYDAMTELYPDWASHQAWLMFGLG